MSVVGFFLILFLLLGCIMNDIFKVEILYVYIYGCFRFNIGIWKLLNIDFFC